MWQWWSSCGLEGQGTVIPEEGEELSRLDEETGDSQLQCPSSTSSQCGNGGTHVALRDKGQWS